jgi:Protein of unknown function (DUF732)
MTDTESKLPPRGCNELLRTAMRLAMLLVPALAAVVALAAPAHADPDTDLNNQLHSYGIYGPGDYNAWLGKITCERLHNGLDTTADKSARFALVNLPRGSTAGQSYQFLAAAISTYCPDQVQILTSAAVRQ